MRAQDEGSLCRLGDRGAGDSVSLLAHTFAKTCAPVGSGPVAGPDCSDTHVVADSGRRDPDTLGDREAVTRCASLHTPSPKRAPQSDPVPWRDRIALTRTLWRILAGGTPARSGTGRR
ncbi:hypothetical protein GCM10009638_07750 [Luteococcus sanguinis]